MAKAKDSAAPATKGAGPELRLLDRRAFVGFPELSVAPGLTLTDFALQIPDVTFPFNVTGGPARYQKKKLDFGFLELSVDAELISRKVAELSAQLAELSELRLHFRPGYLEGQARLHGKERAPVTFKVAFDGDGDALAVYVYDVRLYAFSTTPAAQVPVLLSRALADLGVLPEVELRGANGFVTRILPELVRRAAVSRGYKMPSLDQARLSAAEVSGKGLRLRFSSGGLPPAHTPDEELLLALEGARAFADAEELVAQGKLDPARQAYLKLGDPQDAHPFAVERLLSLLVANPSAHEMALDVAAHLARRRDRSAAALWAEGVVRERRGESARASERYLALCALARKNQEEASAFFAAESAARAARDQAPQMAVRALHELLGLKPDHLPSLKALARASDQAEDRAGAIRAYRRIAALARDPAEAAEAHVHLARLCALTEDDIAGARLHCEAALRLAPDHPEALYQLGELCHAGGEHLRALKALDRLREVAMGRHEVDRVGKANLLAGRVWEKGLGQPENALLRYREAVSLLPGEAEPLYLAARVAESLGKTQEAIAGYQQAIELAGPAPRNEVVRAAAHDAHHALARLYKTKLSDPARARDHLEAALALNERDMVAIDELLPYFRASGKAAELADACEKAAAVVEDPARRAAFWAEAGELYRGRLGNLEKAERLLSAALDADGHNPLALEGMLALAEGRRDGGQLCRCLSALAELAQDPKERARHLRRLSVAARDLAFDLELAARALSELLTLEPDDLPALGELCGLQRRRTDMNGLATALEKRAGAAERQGDKRLAAAALRELAQVLEARLGRVGEALVALEKAARLAPDAGVLFDLAQLSLRCERPEHARRALEDLLSSMPKHAAPERLAEVRALHGRACELCGDFDRAKESYAAAFPLRRLDEELFGRLEALYAQAGQQRELTELWAARAQALLASGRAKEAAPLFFQSAQALLSSGDHAGAVLRLGAALDAAPQGEQAGDILEAMAELEVARGERLEAAKLLAKRASLLEDARASSQAYFRAATLAAGTNREAGFLAKSLERDATYAPARVRRAELTFQTDPRAALADAEAVLALDEGAFPEGVDRLTLTRKAATAARAAGLADTARKHLARYAAMRPEDLEALQELAELHRAAHAKEALCDLLGELWPRLPGAKKQQARKEYAELSLELGRAVAATEALRAVLEAEPTDLWAAQKLLALLPEQDFTGPVADERLFLLSLLADNARGDERGELLVRRARAHRAAGATAAARADLRDAAASSRRSGALYKELAELEREAHDEAGELLAWKEAVRADPGLGELAAARLFELAARRLEAHDYSTAREGFFAAVGLPLAPSERCEAYLGLSRAAEALADEQGAAQALLEASKQGPAPRRCEALLRRGSLLERAGDSSGAAQSYEGALALAPRQAQATESLKRVLTGMEDWSGLAEVLAAEAAGAPRSAAAALFAELGALYLERLGQKGPAEAALRRAAQLDEKNVEVRRRLFTLLAERGELLEATKLLEETAAALEPAKAAAVLREGVALSRRAGDLERALKLARRAHELSSAQGDDLHALAELLYVKGAVKEALPIHQALATQVDFADNPEGAEGALLRLADLAQQVGEASLAERTLRRLVQERPLHSLAVERLAALVHPARPREAIELLAAHAGELAASERAVQLLVELSGRAREELADVELSAQLLRRAAERSPQPLALYRSLAELYRESGRTQELSAQLSQIAALELEQGDVEAALAAYEEEALLAESSGRVDEALRTLVAAVEICEDEGRLEAAAGLERRRAEILRDAKLDLDAAEAALRHAYELHPELVTTQLGAALAARRDDRDGEMDWLERSLAHLGSPEDRGEVFLRLARLHLGDGSGADTPHPIPLPEGEGAADAAEAALREAQKSAAHAPVAEELLAALYEKQGRLADLAAHYEEAAARTRSTEERGRLLLRAAEIYKDRAGKPHQAAAALLAARAAAPDDWALTARAADMLHEIGRDSDAAELDALLLEHDPFHPAFTRHAAYLQEARDDQALGALLLARAERRQKEEAAQSYLAAAAAFRRAGAKERALLCEELAFEAHPADAAAFEAVRARLKGDVRRLAGLLWARAEAVPEESAALLAERVRALADAGETLLAAEALDDLLRVAPDDVSALAQRGDMAATAKGPLAAQPYDRKLLDVGGVSLPVPLRLKTQLRLGHAALEGSAYHDAAEALEAVVALDPEGEKGKEALSLLSEVHARTQNARGLYQTSLLLAARSQGAEAEAFYRRAAALFEHPQDAVDALLPLSKLRPGDQGVVDRAAAALKALGRHGELLDLYERSAQAMGGTAAAEALLAAASLAENELLDSAKAKELREAAARVDPDNVGALRALATAQRRDQDPSLLSTLKHLAESTQDEEEAALLRLEVAELATAHGDVSSARTALEAVAARGPQGVGYATALERLEKLLAQGNEHPALAQVLAQRAELVESGERAQLLLSAAEAMHRGGDDAKAAEWARAALAAKPSVEGLLLLSSLCRATQDLPRAAAALAQAAQLSAPQAQGKLWVEAAEAWEAAGDAAEARDLLERVGKEHPQLLSPEDFAERFLRLGAPELAVAHGYAPALAAGQLQRALQLADAAHDAAKVREVLWAFARTDGAGPHVERLASDLREAHDFEGLTHLADLCVQSGARERAVTLAEEVLRQSTEAKLRRGAFERLMRWEELPRLLDLAVQREGPAEVAELLLEVAREAPQKVKERIFEHLAEHLPARRASLLRALYEHRRAESQLEEAAQTLERLVAAEGDARARAALHQELGELYLAELSSPQKAREAFERALADDSDAVAAVKQLVSLYQKAGEVERFVAMAERAARLIGPWALEPYQEELAHAYQTLGRKEDAFGLLSTLPETEERLKRRAQLALELGLTGEVLTLQEKVTTDRGELLRILEGYARSELVPMAVKLAERLLAEGELPHSLRRLLAERLAPTAQGAALAARLWRSLLREQPLDADGWTLFAEALRVLGREEHARMIDGFGAALTFSSEPSAPARIGSVDAPASYHYPDQMPPGLVPVNDSTMPRLQGMLSEALSGLGAGGMEVWLDPAGGVEAYQISHQGLVLGALALSCFGPAELTYLCALALALGDRGHLLSLPGDIEGLSEAVVTAFDAYPASLAAARVLTQLDARVRGMDPSLVQMSELLPDSQAFRAVASHALQMVE
ncbi:MAG: flagellar hook-length control protein FliK [Myxococcota bacterium]